MELSYGHSEDTASLMQAMYIKAIYNCSHYYDDFEAEGQTLEPQS